MAWLLKASRPRSERGPDLIFLPMVASGPYGKNVLIKGPFDPEYQQVFDALVFAGHERGYVTRSAAQERRETGEVRIDKILRRIEAAQFESALLCPRVDWPASRPIDAW